MPTSSANLPARLAHVLGVLVEIFGWRLDKMAAIALLARTRTVHVSPHTLEFASNSKAQHCSKTVTPNYPRQTHDTDKMGIDLGTELLKSSSTIMASNERPLDILCKPL